VSGDYYDFIPLGDQRLGLLLADVSGKGMPAALLGASLHGAVRARAPAAGDGCGRLLAEVSAMLFETTAPEMFATVFYGVYDGSSRTLTYANAGHYPPFLVGSDGGRPECSRLESLTIPVAMRATLPVAERSIVLTPGDRLLVSSDGIPESCDENGEEFGDERLRALVRERRNLGAAELCSVVEAAVRDHARGCLQSDDRTVIAVVAR